MILLSLAIILGFMTTGSSSLKGKAKIDEDEVKQEGAEEENGQQQAPSGDTKVAQIRNDGEVNGKLEVGEVGGRLEVGKTSSSKESKPQMLCRFCKKGFSSPQALGGHMNCHKTDREKEVLHKAWAKVQEQQAYALHPFCGPSVTFPNQLPMEQIPPQSSIAYSPIEPEVNNFFTNSSPPPYNSKHTQHPQIAPHGQFGQYAVPSGQVPLMSYTGSTSGAQSHVTNEYQADEHGPMVMGLNDGNNPARMARTPNPAQGAPGYATPVQGAPGYANPAQSAPGYTNPVQGAPGYANPAQSAPTYTNPVQGAPGYTGPAQAARGYTNPAQGAPRYPQSSVASTSQNQNRVQIQDNTAQQLQRRPSRGDLGSSPPGQPPGQRQVQHQRQQQSQQQRQQQNLQQHQQQQQRQLQNLPQQQQQQSQQQQLNQHQQQVLQQQQQQMFSHPWVPQECQVPDGQSNAQDVEWYGYLNECGSGAPGFDESSQNGQGGGAPSQR